MGKAYRPLVWLLVALCPGWFLPQTARAADSAEEARLKGEIARLRKERDLLEKQRREYEKQIVELQKQINELRKAQRTAEVEARAAQARAEQFLRQVEGLTKENARLRAKPEGPPVGAAERSGWFGGLLPLPPAEIRGRVTAVAANGLVQISVGADAGLRPGDTLEVFQLGTKPEDARYLGRLTVQRVNPRAAVGQFKSASSVKLPREGDEVASKILPR